MKQKVKVGMIGKIFDEIISIQKFKLRSCKHSLRCASLYPAAYGFDLALI